MGHVLAPTRSTHGRTAAEMEITVTGRAQNALEFYLVLEKDSLFDNIDLQIKFK